jgi:hypothetical protein
VKATASRSRGRGRTPKRHSPRQDLPGTLTCRHCRLRHVQVQSRGTPSLPARLPETRSPCCSGRYTHPSLQGTEKPTTREPWFTRLTRPFRRTRLKLDARRRSELSVVRRESSAPHAPPADLLDGVACNDSEWRQHDATSGPLEPPPKGEGTVWQSARLNRSDQTAIISTAKRENEAWPRAFSPASLGTNRQ